MMSCVEASPRFSTDDGQELDRFSMSTSQHQDLEPRAQMLAQHTMRNAVLPDIYAGKAKIDTLFDLISRVQLALCDAARLAADSPDLLLAGSGWKGAGLFRP